MVCIPYRPLQYLSDPSQESSITFLHHLSLILAIYNYSYINSVYKHVHSFSENIYKVKYKKGIINTCADTYVCVQTHKYLYIHTHTYIVRERETGVGGRNLIQKNN
jgi:hypothetical protein